jgi:hypothetical protein
MLHPDVAVTTEQHQGKYIGLILAKRFLLMFGIFLFY